MCARQCVCIIFDKCVQDKREPMVARKDNEMDMRRRSRVTLRGGCEARCDSCRGVHNSFTTRTFFCPGMDARSAATKDGTESGFQAICSSMCVLQRGVCVRARVRYEITSLSRGYGAPASAGNNMISHSGHTPDNDVQNTDTVTSSSTMPLASSSSSSAVPLHNLRELTGP